MAVAETTSSFIVNGRSRICGTHNASKENTRLAQLLVDFKMQIFIPDIPTVLCDNQSPEVEKKKIKIQYLPTQEMIAEMLTKGLYESRLKSFLEKMKLSDNN